MTKQRRWVLLSVGALLWFPISSATVKLIDLFRHPWAEALPEIPKNASAKERLVQGMQSFVDDKGFREDKVLPLANFKNRVGRNVTIEVAGGFFFDDAIQPSEVWGHLGKRILLLDSVDEYASISGGISGPIGRGCGLPAIRPLPLNLGDATLVPCSGVYQSNYHVKWVGELTSIVWSNPGSPAPPCWNAYGLTSDTAKYRQCVQDAVTHSLQSLFANLRESHDVRPDLIIVPAIGTGTGGLPQDKFYASLFDTFYGVLSSPGGEDILPARIVLLVKTPFDSPEDWVETRTAISSNLVATMNRWITFPHKNDLPGWTGIIGIAAAFSVLLLMLAAEKLPSWAEFRALSSPSLNSMLLIAGWIAAAYGIVAGLQNAMSFMPPAWSPWWQIACGFVSTILTGPILRSADLFKAVAVTADPVEAGRH